MQTRQCDSHHTRDAVACLVHVTLHFSSPELLAEKTVRIWTQDICRKKCVIHQYKTRTIWSSALNGMWSGMQWSVIDGTINQWWDCDSIKSTLNTCLNNIVFFQQLTSFSSDFLSEFDVFHCEISHMWLPVLQSIANITCVMRNKTQCIATLFITVKCVSVPKIIKSDQQSSS